MKPGSDAVKRSDESRTSQGWSIRQTGGHIFKGLRASLKRDHILFYFPHRFISVRCGVFPPTDSPMSVVAVWGRLACPLNMNIQSVICGLFLFSKTRCHVSSFISAFSGFVQRGFWCLWQNVINERPSVICRNYSECFGCDQATYSSVRQL